ncbi:MAG: MetS family NSS transporter small subunit [Rubrobacter sp.]
MNFGAIVMLLIGAIGLWGGLILFIRHYFKAVREEEEANDTARTDRD